MTSAWVRGTSSVQPSVAVRSPVRTLRGSSTSVAGRIGFPWTTPSNIEASSSYEERTAVSRWLYWCTATSFVPSHSTSIRIERATSATTSRSSSVGAPSLVSGYLRVTSAEILSGAAGNAVSVRSCSPASRQSGVRCASTFAPKYRSGIRGGCVIETPLRRPGTVVIVSIESPRGCSVIRLVWPRVVISTMPPRGLNAASVHSCVFVVTAPPGSASVLRVRTSRLLPNPTSMISKIS